MPESIRTWLKDQMRLIEKQELCNDKCEKILDLLEHYSKYEPEKSAEIEKIVDELALEKIHGENLD